MTLTLFIEHSLFDKIYQEKQKKNNGGKGSVGIQEGRSKKGMWKGVTNTNDVWNIHLKMYYFISIMDGEVDRQTDDKSLNGVDLHRG